MARLINKKNANDIIKQVSRDERAAVIDHMLENDEVSIRNWGLAGWCVAAAVPIAASALVAHELAGKTTELNVELTLWLGVSFVGVAAVLGVVLRNRVKRISELTALNRELKHGLHQLQKRLRDKGLPDTYEPPKPAKKR